MIVFLKKFCVIIYIEIEEKNKIEKINKKIKSYSQLFTTKL